MSYKNGRFSFIVESKPCAECGQRYYPPQQNPESEYPVENCKKGYHLPLCGVCKKRREKIKINLTRIRRRGPAKPKKWELIIEKLKIKPQTNEELLTCTASPKPHISYLRSIGYDIRCVSRYEIVREPKNRLVEKLP